MPVGLLHPRISVLAALSSTGEVHLALTQSNSNSNMMNIFFRQLVLKLDRERPQWRERVVLIMDGAVSYDYAPLCFLTLCFCFSGLPPECTHP